MKNKNVSKLLAATVAASAIVAPAGALAAETTTTSAIAEGVYFADQGKFYTADQLSKLNASELGKLLTNNAKVFIYVKGTGTASLAQIAAKNGSFIAAANANGSKDKPENIIPNADYVTADGKTITIGPKLTVLGSVSPIDATTIEVTFNNKLASLPAASEFSIPGISVNGTKFKEDTDQKVVVLTTSTQSAQNYTLTYNGQSKSFIGKTNLGSVLLTAEKYEVEIDPASGKLTPVEINAQLANFPEGAEAVIEFTTSFGKVVKSQTTQNGKAVFQLTPLETLTDQTAVVTGKVVEVKNPTTGQTYPEYRNSSVGSINVTFKIVDKKLPAPVNYTFTAYADQADRVYLKAAEGLTGDISKALEFQTEKFIKAATTDTKKELYRHLHDVLYSQINDKVESVVKGKTTFTKDDVKKVKEELQKVFVDSNDKDITATDLRNILYADTIGATGSRYSTVYLPLLQPGKDETERSLKLKLKAEVDSISAQELEGILSYYKLLSKFVVLNNVKDSVAPQNADSILVVEHIYKEESNGALVLVLPTDRAKTDRNYAAAKADQKYKDSVKQPLNIAKFLTDNTSHQVIFANNEDKDGYSLKGDPTFKLEDATSLKLIAVQNGRYKVQSVDSSTNVSEASNYCPAPFAVEVDGSFVDDGGVVIDPTTPPSYTGTVKFGPSTYTISDEYMKFDNALGVKNVDKLGELKVVFSESVSLNDKNDILDPKNWTIDGINLADIEKEGFDIHFRIASTDTVKQLRDTVIITFTSKAIANDNTKDRDNKWLEKLLEDTAKGKHKLEISKAGDWAAVTDTKNMVPTQSLDYSGLSNPSAWGPAVKTGTISTNTAHKALIAGVDAFVTRAAGAQSALGDGKDVIHILFSEPMKIDGTDSILEKANYRLDGQALPEDTTSIRLGIEGAYDKTSTCAVTIELPDGYLQGKDNDHVLAINNVKGLDDTNTLNQRIQLAYARQYTVVTNKPVSINGTLVGKGALSKFEGISSLLSKEYEALNAAKTGVEERVYKDTKGEVLVLTNNDAQSTLKWSIADFFTKHLSGTNASNPGNTAPTIALATGVPSTINYTIGDAQPTFSEADVKVADADGDTTTVTVDASAVKFDTAGTYKVTYKVTDGKGGQATTTRDVVVKAKEEGTGVTVGSISEAKVTKVIDGVYNIKITIAQLTAAGFKDVTKASSFEISGTASRYIEADDAFLFPAISVADETAAKALNITQNK